MSQTKTVSISGETKIEFDAVYPYVWVRNLGNSALTVWGDVGDTVSLSKLEAVRVITNTDYIYVSGTGSVEVIAQGIPDSPYKGCGGGSGGGGQAVINSLSITENGTYTASGGVDGYSPVTVNVPKGAEIITRTAWDLLTEEQKQAKGLCAIQDYSTGFVCGEFVNGADYIQANKYIPYTDEYKVLGVAYPDLFDASGNSWGYGEKPVLYTGTGGKPTLSTQESAVYFPTNTSDVIGYVDLGAENTPFTVYVVMKAVSPAGRLVSCTEQTQTNRLIMLTAENDTVYVDSWGSGSSLGVSAVSDYFVAAMTSSITSGYGYCYDAANDTVNSMNKSLSATGRYITIGRTDIDALVQYPAPTDIYVRYIAVVNEAENGTAIINNIRNLYNQFVASE